MFNVKQLKMNKFIKYIWQLIISTSNATIEVPSLHPCDMICRFFFFILILSFARPQVKSLIVKFRLLSRKTAMS